MRDIDTMAEDELWERREYLLEQRQANLDFPRALRSIRMELLQIADELDKGMW